MAPSLDRPPLRTRLALALLPDRLVYADRLTPSARRLFVRVGVGVLGLVVAAAGVGLLNSDNWADVVAGALFAWSTSFVVWSVASYRSGSSETAAKLRRMAESDLLHARLNLVAEQVGLPMVDLDAEFEVVVAAREERLAHFAGFDEFRGETTVEGAAFWTPQALGRPLDG